MADDRLVNHLISHILLISLETQNFFSFVVTKKVSYPLPLELIGCCDSRQL